MRKDKKTETSNVQFELPSYAEIGPYDVRTQSLKINNDKSLEITIWYPAENETASDQEI